MVMFANTHDDSARQVTREDGRAAAANTLSGALIVLDPENKLGLQELLRTVWRVSHLLGPSPNPRADEAPAAAIVPPPVSADLVSHMVNRFLAWRLPENFSPDGGITFTRVMNEGTVYAHTAEPSGTNLLDAEQATAMVRHMLEGAPPVSKGDAAYAQWRASQTAEFDGTTEGLARARDMFEKWIGDALPANDDGQVHFARALAESMSDAIGAYLKRRAEAPPASAEIENVDDLRNLAVHERDKSDDEIIRNFYEPDKLPSYGEINFGHVRALLRAAGLFTDDMRPSQPVTPVGAADASVRPADGDAASPPAVADDDGSYPPPCSDPGGHKFEGTGTAYGGEDDRWGGEGRMLCIHCGADGDA